MRIHHYSIYLILLSWLLFSLPFEAQAQQPKTDPLGDITFCPKLGYVWYAPHKGANLELSSRHGLLTAFSFDFDLGGYAFELAPTFTIEWPDEGPRLYALGGHIQLVYRFRFGNLYPAIGGGMRAAYLFKDENGEALELYGRLPLQVTIYFSSNLALVLETGIMYGVTGRYIRQSGDYFRFIDGFAIDTVIGIRFP